MYPSAVMSLQMRGALPRNAVLAMIALPDTTKNKLGPVIASRRPMFSIQKFFSHDGKFFDLLEASADETRALTRLLVELLKARAAILRQAEPFDRHSKTAPTRLFPRGGPIPPFSRSGNDN